MALDINCSVCSKSNFRKSSSFDKGLILQRTLNKKRKREREPSRIPLKSILKATKKNKDRKKVKLFVRKSIPNSSFITNLCRDYKTLRLWRRGDNFYSKYAVNMKAQKQKLRQEHCCSCIHHCYKSSLKGGMYHNVADAQDSLWNCLTQKLAQIGLVPHDVGGSGDCFFKSVSHQLYGNADLHYDIRMAGISHLQNHPELYIESISNDSWKNYTKQMSTPGTWCDHVIIQAVANALNCVIHITESNPDSQQPTIITPINHQGIQQTVFIGHINGLHYVSTLTDRNSQNISTLKNQKRMYLSEYNKEWQEKLATINVNNQTHFSEETTEKRTEKLTKKRGNYQKKSCQETPEKRQDQLASKRASSKKQRSRETLEQKEERLSKKRASYKRQLSQETPEKREDRLAKKRASNKKQLSEETGEQRKDRLTKKRTSNKKHLSEETGEKRQERLAKMKANYKKQSCREAPEKRREALVKKRANGKKQISQQSAIETQETLINSPIHEQTQAKNNIDMFHMSNNYSVYQCSVCFEAWPIKTRPRVANQYRCSRCTNDKEQPKKFSKENNMIPSSVPSQLEGLTQIEEMLIAQALPILRVYIKPGGQRGYSGHCINLPQNVAESADSLPRYPKDLSVIVVKMKGKDNNLKDVTVRRQNVLDALHWLIKNNPYYKDIVINQDSLNSLPLHGVPQDLLSIETENVESSEVACDVDLGPLNEEDIVYNKDTEMSSFLPIPECQQQEVQALQQQLCDQDTHIPWPTVDNDPLNEYQTPFLATLAFPTLFPDGKGDPTNPSLHRDVPLSERVKHLLRFGENRDGKWYYRFASHPRFSYWALNMIQRKRILQQTGIFLKQNPGEAHLTTEELQQMAADNTAHVFLSKLSRYLGNLTGSNAYWHKAKEDLKAIIGHVGPPTFFFTFSSADMHWPQLHSLFRNPEGDATPESRRKNVINNPHITDWFFTQRLENFIKYWLYSSLGAAWHWYRFEYQARGSIHCHGVAKLKNDPGLCQLSDTALKGYLAEISIHKAEESHIQELQKHMLEGKKASQAVCEYVDWLLSTYNPNPPEDGFWIKPSIHPCQREHKDIVNSVQYDDDYVDLLNTVQRHTRCNTNYCLRKKENETELKVIPLK